MPAHVPQGGVGVACVQLQHDGEALCADAVQDHDLSCWISYGMFQVVAELVILSLVRVLVFCCFSLWHFWLIPPPPITLFNDSKLS